MKTIEKIKKTLGSKAVLMVLAMLFVMASCSDEDGLNTDLLEEEAALLEDEQDADEGLDASSDVFSVMDLAQVDNNLKVSDEDVPPDSAYSCATITHNREEKVITIDFGEGCVGLDGVLREGKIIITYTAHYLIPGAVITKTFEEYFVNEKQVEGFITITNIAPDLNSNPEFNAVLEGGKFTWEDGSFATRESDFIIEWVNAQNPLNDQFEMDGFASGVNRRGVAYEMNITSTLIKKVICKLEGVYIPVQGIKVLEREGLPTLTIDFGNGDCDNEVTITRGDQSRTVTVGRWRHRDRVSDHAG